MNLFQPGPTYWISTWTIFWGQDFSHMWMWGLFVSLFLKGEKTGRFGCSNGLCAPHLCPFGATYAEEERRVVPSCTLRSDLQKGNHSELSKTITEVCTGNLRLWAFPWDAEVEAAGRMFWMHGLAPNPNPNCFPLDANRHGSFGSLSQIQVPK